MLRQELVELVSEAPLLFWPESECRWISNHGVNTLKLPNTTAVTEVHFAHYGILDDTGRVIQFGAIVGGAVFSDVSVDYEKSSASGMNGYYDGDEAHSWAPGHEEGNGLHETIPLHGYIKAEVRRSVDWSSVRLRDLETALMIQRRRDDLKARDKRIEQVKFVSMVLLALGIILYLCFFPGS